jgi:hypothetical protein
MSNSNLYESVTIRAARTDSDIRTAINVRWQGYKKYEMFKDPDLEELDLSSNCTILLAEDSSGVALGTIRILDRRYGPIELDRFINVDDLMPYNPRSVAEATRFSIPVTSRSRIVKHLLWKAYFNYCYENSIDLMLVSVKECAKKDYDFLQFVELKNGTYTHPSLGNLPHFCFYLETLKALTLYKERNHPMYHFFNEVKFNNIQIS